jgi:hypothetical protein
MVMDRDWQGPVYYWNNHLYWVDGQNVFRINTEGTGKVQLK